MSIFICSQREKIFDFSSRLSRKTFRLDRKQEVYIDEWGEVIPLSSSELQSQNNRTQLAFDHLMSRVRYFLNNRIDEETKGKINKLGISKDKALTLEDVQEVEQIVKKLL